MGLRPGGGGTGLRPGGGVGLRPGGAPLGGGAGAGGGGAGAGAGAGGGGGGGGGTGGAAVVLPQCNPVRPGAPPVPTEFLAIGQKDDGGRMIYTRNDLMAYCGLTERWDFVLFCSWVPGAGRRGEGRGRRFFLWGSERGREAWGRYTINTVKEKVFFFFAAVPECFFELGVRGGEGPRHLMAVFVACTYYYGCLLCRRSRAGHPRPRS